MKKIFYTLIVLLVLLLGLTFSLKNPQLVDLNYYRGLSWQGPLPIVVGVVFGFGVLVGWLLSLLGRIKTSVRLSRAKRDNRRAERQIEQLKTSAEPSSSRQMAA